MPRAPSIRSFIANGRESTTLNQPRSLGANGAPNAFQFRGPQRQVFVAGVEVGGGESKGLHLFSRAIHTQLLRQDFGPYPTVSTSLPKWLPSSIRASASRACDQWKFSPTGLNCASVIALFKSSKSCRDPT